MQGNARGVQGNAVAGLIFDPTVLLATKQIMQSCI